jgi:putative phosphoribosyl transferase
MPGFWLSSAARTRIAEEARGGTAMIFQNRNDAGRRLARKLEHYSGRSDVRVLAIPRGGVPVAFQVAAKLGAPLDVFVVRKLGVPSQPELAFGAIASGGIRILDEQIMEAMGVSEREIEQIAAEQGAELNRRERVYRGRRAPLHLEGKTVILVDDGIATGASTRAAITALRELKPARIVLAAPVAPASTCRSLRSEVDDLVCLDMPETFYAIGQFYEDFSQVTDDEVTTLLELNSEQSANQTEIARGTVRKGIAP